MEFLINEQQLRLILEEQDKSKMSEYMKELYSFTHNVVDKVMKTYGLNLKMLLTWGASVGGVIRPLDVWLKSGNFNLTDSERALILVGVGMTLFFESKSTLTRLIKKIKEVGLEDSFNVAVDKAKELQLSFIDFMESLNLSMGIFLDIVAYSFLIPILTDIHSIAIKSTTPKDAAITIAERLVASGVVVVGAKTLVSIIKKLLRRFK